MLSDNNTQLEEESVVGQNLTSVIQLLGKAVKQHSENNKARREDVDRFVVTGAE